MRKKAAIINGCIILILFLAAGVNGSTDTDQESVERLLMDRTDILNHFYGGKMTYDDAKLQIEKIEADTLLKEDLKLMKAHDGSEVDLVAEYDITIETCQRTSYGIIKGRVDIFWLMQGEENRWETKAKYFFTGEEHQGEMKLTQLKKI